MNKKYFFISLFLFLTSGFMLEAQIENVKVKSGPENKRTMRLNFAYSIPVGAVNGQYYGQLVPWGQVMANTTATDKYKLYQLTPALDLETYEVLEPRQDKMDTEFEFIVAMKNKLWLFVSFQNQKLKKNILLCRPVNSKTLLPEGELKPVVEIDYSKTNKYNSAMYNYSFSPDSTKLLLRYGMLDKDQAYISFGFTVVDDKMNVLWKLENNLPAASENKTYAFDQFSINNQGDIFLLCKVFDSKREFKASDRYKSNPFVSRRQQQPNYSWVLFSFREKGSKNNEYPLEIQGKFIRSLQIGNRADGDLICAGLYGGPQNLSVTGTCSFILKNNIDAEIKPASAEFSFKTISKGIDDNDLPELTKYYKQGDEFEDYLYKVKNILFAEDGRFWLVAEQYRQRVQNSNGAITQVQDNDGVYVTGFSPDGSIIWSDKLSKDQITKDLEVLFSGIFVHAMNDKLYVLYNELPVNAINMIQYKKSSLMITEYDNKGTEKTKPLLNIDQSEVIICPEFSCKMADNRLILFGYKGTLKYRFFEVDF